jgi:hypothetical protein
MPITENDFKKAKKGDGFKDIYGRVWKVTNVIGGSFSTLMTELDGYGHEKLHLMDGKIMDEEFGIIIELNNSKAEFVSK